MISIHVFNIFINSKFYLIFYIKHTFIYFYLFKFIIYFKKILSFILSCVLSFVLNKMCIRHHASSIDMCIQYFKKKF